MDDYALMTLDADTSFTYDGRGRMLLTNEPCAAARRPAPRLFVGRAVGGDVVRFAASLPGDIARQVSTILSREPPINEIRDEPLAAQAAIAETLARHARVESQTAGPSYCFPEAMRSVGPDVTQLLAQNRELARETYPWLYDEIVDWQPCFAVVRDGAAVSVCFSSRVGERAAAAGVDTRPEFRGHGYAAAVTAAWASAVRASGREPLYGTDWQNLASQAVARRLGLRRMGVHLTWQ